MLAPTDRMEPAQRVAVPPRLGRYVTLNCLGVGGMGSVYAAWDLELHRRVALKILHEGSRRQLLLREAQALAQLSHPNVVTVYDVGSTDERVFIAMELVQGTSLRRWLMAAPRGRGQILSVFVQAARGLAAAHDAGMVHRDFKPDNVLVGDDGVVRVADFGLARAVRDGDDVPPSVPSPPSPLLAHHMTRTGAAVGTPRYMSPEQRDGRPADARSDQYSFCVALWEALRGEHPVLKDEAARPERAAVPARLRSALERGLSADADARWPSMTVLADELGRGRSRRPWAVAGAAAVVAVAAAGVLWVRGHDPERGCAAAVAWGEPDRTAIRAAAPAALPTLDRYVADLGAMQVEACRARARGEDSETTHDLRAQCLARRAHQLQVLSAELSRADVDLAARAADAAASLPPVAECADVLALSAPARVPPAPLRRAVAALRDEVDTAGALQLAGRYLDGRIHADGAVLVARLVGFRPALAEALGQRGSAEIQLERLTDAESSLRQSVLAAQASGDDGTAVYAETRLLYAIAYDGRRMADARLWGQLADATLERMGTTPEADRLRAKLEERMGDLEHRAGRLPEAEAHARRGLALWERVNPESHNVCDALSILSGILDERGRADEAEALARREIALWRKLNGPPYDVAMAYKQLANAEMNQHRPAEALADLERAADLARASHGPGSMIMAAILNNRAIAKVKLGRYDDAVADYREARTIYVEHLGAGSPKVAMTLENEAGIYLKQKRFPEAKAKLVEALAVDEQSVGADSPELVLVLDKLAWLAAVEKHFAEAAPYADRALAIAEKHDAQGKLTASALNYDAFAHSDKPREAVPIYRRAAGAYERVFGARSTELANVLVELGMLEIDVDPAAARASLERARDISDAALSPEARRALARLPAQAGRKPR